MVIQTPLLISESNATKRLRNIFASVDAMSCPHRLNFHLHTVHSDGKMQPVDLIQQAIALRVSDLAITDHHAIAGYYIAKKYLDRSISQSSDPQSLPTLWSGIEVNASLIFTEVHILGYGFDPEHKAMLPYLQGKTTAGLDYQAISVIKAMHLAGGLAVLAHPARYRRSPEDLIPAAAALGIDGVETYYGYDNSDPWKPSPRQTEEIRHLAESHGLLHTCGTDSHGFKISKRL
ncbi:PHP domain-containing protein [Pseudanabaena galeata UHCC 0370]|jgi:predicted metal-dependent phosphoesterase TrpH|uniref:PHP domain-containing protein n=1 Tax=Pseudanabaena galeata UHCC 0370 TaxID=3110310 RepID=A0ABU5TCQ3_9CYAN|nr:MULTISPECIES: PHP domain-containing protein [Pseudanabaena]MEA5476045.1 PHP domain-containing protein [Pseudanabaena galeata UHCC 0370]MEA5487395.1 PHP domain-containing protein [Pseudanabaena sp. CCNP1317]WGS73170.1 PHP domain-containing protein [Pseudanabaena galeata CCNP1313]